MQRGLRAVVAALTLVVFTLTGCEDDPILSPENVEDTGTGGSYGRLDVPGERPPYTETPSSAGEADRSRIGDERGRPENPERF